MTPPKVLIDAGESLQVTAGWTELESDPDAIYWLPVKAVKLAPGVHVLRPVGTMRGDLAIECDLKETK